MTKFYRALQNYLLYALPLVIIAMIWSRYVENGQASQEPSFLIKVLWEILAWNLMIWFAGLFLFFILLVLYPSARDQVLKRVANIKERDEREQFITGKASRTAFISTLSILSLLLFLSIFQVEVRRLPEDQIVDGKTKALSIGMKFELFDDPKSEWALEGTSLFESKDIPLSKTGIILMALIWLIASFNLSARREMRDV